jgi:hypothetical protein
MLSSSSFRPVKPLVMKNILPISMSVFRLYHNLTQPKRQTPLTTYQRTIELNIKIMFQDAAWSVHMMMRKLGLLKCMCYPEQKWQCTTDERSSFVTASIYQDLPGVPLED